MLTEDVRTVESHIKNIREVFRPSISDLSSVLSVPAQDLYLYSIGTRNPETKKLFKIIKLSSVADKIKNLNSSFDEIIKRASLLDRFNLTDLLQSIDIVEEYIDILSERKE
jgi:hypothetical protein